MAQVFLSYKRENLQPVQRLVKALRDEGVEVWWDQDIQPGAPWEETIEQEHAHAKVLIVAWSKAAVASENVKAEARRARNEGRLLQIFIEPCEPPMFFGERQGLDFSGWTGKRTDRAFVTLLAAVRALIAGKAPPTGVGFAPRKRNVTAIVWSVVAALSVVVGLVGGLSSARDAVCSLPGLNGVCKALHMVTPPADPAVVAKAQRQKLIHGLDGQWDGERGDCTTPTAISTWIGPDGEARIKIGRGASFVSQGQVMSAEKGVIESRDIAVAPGKAREVWEYEPQGDLIKVTDPKGQAVTLHRCLKPGG